MTPNTNKYDSNDRLGTHCDNKILHQYSGIPLDIDSYSKTTAVTRTNNISVADCQN